MATYALGDIHGAFKAMEQVFERSDFTPEEDKLIFLGDVADGWPQVPQCVDFLLSLPDAVFIQGNHDVWAHEWLRGEAANAGWLGQGGAATWKAYKELTLSQQRRHKTLYFDRMVPYYELDNNLYVHGGYDWREPIENQEPQFLCWDRDLWQVAANHNFRVKDYNEVFIGHTTTTRTSLVPEQRSNVWNCDQGVGWEGKLSLMNVDTKEFWQSDVVKSLYEGHPGRGEFKW